MKRSLLIYTLSCPRYSIPQARFFLKIVHPLCYNMGVVICCIILCICTMSAIWNSDLTLKIHNTRLYQFRPQISIATSNTIIQNVAVLVIIVVFLEYVPSHLNYIWCLDGEMLCFYWAFVEYRAKCCPAGCSLTSFERCVSVELSFWYKYAIVRLEVC